jgi:hypothetical protein
MRQGIYREEGNVRSGKEGTQSRKELMKARDSWEEGFRRVWWKLKEEDIRGGKDERKKEFKTRKDTRDENIKKGRIAKRSRLNGK